MSWKAKTVRFDCVTCRHSCGAYIENKSGINCPSCGKAMKRSKCGHAVVVKRPGSGWNDPKKGKCGQCGVWLDWED